MSVQIYNAVSGKKEPFVSLKEGEVRVYVCGVTVYDASRIARAGSFPTFDLFHRSSSVVGDRALFFGGKIWQMS